ncbi:M48 family metallopeptidase [Thioclava litoralis]|uniref:M48 family metallopeptidase n=1 Tax=Thioclava litoralis TaxID=3076557 RepID=A0ABZ1E0L7_9RHOB|nr:M48 family metallopeptidase [Thioclava sp. FTW29]
MIRLLVLLLPVLAAVVMWQVSAWSLARRLDKSATRLKDPLLLAGVDRLAAAMELRAIPVYVQEVPTINGLAAPDGRVFLTRGFLRRYESGEVGAEELLSVIAHELGHVALGHSKRRMIDFAGQNLVRMLIFSVLGRMVPFLGPLLANLATRALAARLSQQDEYEADEFATALMIKAGYGAEPQIRLFEKLDALTRQGPRSTPAWLMTHPETRLRVETIRRNVAKWTGTGSKPPSAPPSGRLQ